MGSNPRLRRPRYNVQCPRKSRVAKLEADGLLLLRCRISRGSAVSLRPRQASRAWNRPKNGTVPVPPGRVGPHRGAVFGCGRMEVSVCREALVGARREARLRREYAAWYPTLSVTAWIAASTAARAVARQLLDGEPEWARPPRWAVGPRLLDDRHFMFRGGLEGRAPTAHTRREDPPAGGHRGAPKSVQRDDALGPPE
jgi:hypothetical protein